MAVIKVFDVEPHPVGFSYFSAKKKQSYSGDMLVLLSRKISC